MTRSVEAMIRRLRSPICRRLWRFQIEWGYNSVRGSVVASLRFGSLSNSDLFTSAEVQESNQETHDDCTCDSSTDGSSVAAVAAVVVAGRSMGG